MGLSMVTPGCVDSGGAERRRAMIVRRKRRAATSTMARKTVDATVPTIAINSTAYHARCRKCILSPSLIRDLSIHENVFAATVRNNFVPSGLHGCRYLVILGPEEDSSGISPHRAQRCVVLKNLRRIWKQ